MFQKTQTPGCPQPQNKGKIMRKNRIGLFFAVLCLSLAANGAQAQQKYWIVFKDKPATGGRAGVSPLAARNRLLQKLPVCQPTDQPVSKYYLQELQNLGIRPQVVSKWLNAASARLDANQMTRLGQLPFVAEITPIDGNVMIASTAQTVPEGGAEKPPPSEGIGGGRWGAVSYSTALNQIGAKALTDQGLTGKGVKIGVIDVGFYGLKTNASLQHLHDENRIAETRDYVKPERKDDFFAMETHSDWHGAEVVQMIAGYNPVQRVGFGMATGSSFYLARTDHGIRETRTEEDNWVAAIERMDSLGVRLVNTSLGYAKGFSNPKENYRPADMDGQTSKISRAAQIAADQKGMLIVVSAGNEGDDPGWRIISTPADAAGVLAVGATKAKSRDKVGYSSIGPNFLAYLKPNVSCFAANGTSFAAPVIAGLAACLMEKSPGTTNKQLMRIIEKSAHLYPYGNNYVGYGVPDASKALQLLGDSTLKLNNIRELRIKGDAFKYAVASPETERAVVFQKRDGRTVVKQEVIAVVAGRLEFRRHPEARRTTVDLDGEVLEIFWERD